MIRNIIEIDEEKCIGCGACAAACQEGAIGMVNGKAKLLRDDYCDGLGNCLPVCPTDAISIVRRDTDAFDEKGVSENLQRQNLPEKKETPPLPCGCPGTHERSLQHTPDQKMPSCLEPVASELMQWPVQIKLASVDAAFFASANLLVAADCTAYAYADFHKKFISGKITLIGCPKLDDGDYTEKLTEIMRRNNILSVTVVKMQVPCCAKIESAVLTAVRNSGKEIPVAVVTISVDGEIV